MWPRRGIDAADDRRQPSGRVNGRFASRFDDRAGDPPREALLAIGEDRVGQLALAGPRHQIGRRAPFAPIHAHVERLVALEAEPASRRVELQRGDAEIREGAVNQVDVAAIEHLAERPVVGVNQLHAIAPRRQRFTRQFEGVLIAIEADEPGCPGFEQRPGMPAEPDGAVNENAAAFRLQELEHFSRHDRYVDRQIPNSDSVRASSSVYASRCSLVRRRSWFQTSRQL